ncbi:fibronectin type III domain-containing protein [Ochrovirga pacifica]|uniref:fibronectin type III domain-containing protein n=1 Tax=Ochrovirga pacifica TaxID=1042376 RepID=UPI0002557FC1|nr:fibronectin type III [Ochrovirga pacifica]
MKKTLFYLLLTAFAFSCSKSNNQNTPKVQPTAAQLVSPVNNEPCNQGNVLDDITKSEVTLSWNKSNFTNSYTLVITNLTTTQSSQENYNTNQAVVTLDRDTSYSWYVISRTNESDLIAESEHWTFYNAAEGEVNHVPYPASLISPLQKDTTTSSNVTFSWKGEDNDNDIASYEIYLGNDENNLVLQETTSNQTITISLNANTHYFWRVYTKDTKGNISISNLFEFTSGD